MKRLLTAPIPSTQAQELPLAPLNSSTPADILEQQYRENVELMAKLKSPRKFGNGAPIHAAIIFESFFRNASRSVKIFCKNLDREVFGRQWLFEAAKAAFARGVNISVIVKKEPEQSEFKTWLESVRETPAVSFCLLKNSPAKSSDLECNFATMDSIAYRFEPNEDEITAVACMNDPDAAGRLDALHKQLVA